MCLAVPCMLGSDVESESKNYFELAAAVTRRIEKLQEHQKTDIARVESDITKMQGEHLLQGWRVISLIVELRVNTSNVANETSAHMERMNARIQALEAKRAIASDSSTMRCVVLITVMCSIVSVLFL